MVTGQRLGSTPSETGNAETSFPQLFIIPGLHGGSHGFEHGPTREGNDLGGNLHSFWETAKGMAKDTTEAFSLFGRDVARAIGEAGKAYLNKFLTEVAIPKVRGVSSEKTEGVQDDGRPDVQRDTGLLGGPLPEGNEEDRPAGGDSSPGVGVREADAQGDGSPATDRPDGRGGVDGSEESLLHRPPAGTGVEAGGLADSPLQPTGKLSVLAGENPGNFVITDEVGLGDGTDGEKIERNLQALRTLRKVQELKLLCTVCHGPSSSGKSQN